jgi:hypothetical protein
LAHRESAAGARQTSAAISAKFRLFRD